MHYTFRNSDKILHFKTKHNFFKNSFFPSVIIEWKKLNPRLRRCDGYNVFKSNILKTVWLLLIGFLIAILLLESNISYEFDLDLVICESMNSNLTFRIHSILYATVVMMLIESAIHFFLHCPLYSYERHTLLNGSVNIDQTLLDNTDFSRTQILLFGNTTFNARENRSI